MAFEVHKQRIENLIQNYQKERDIQRTDSLCYTVRCHATLLVVLLAYKWTAQKYSVKKMLGKQMKKSPICLLNRYSSVAFFLRWAFLLPLRKTPKKLHLD